MKNTTSDKRTYTKLLTIDSYIGRYEYLKIGSSVGEETFGFDRYLNQAFYHSEDWVQIRNYVIARDMGLDMAFPGYEISGRVYIHHMNPITLDDITDRSRQLLDPEFLICVSHNTHNAIHYGSSDLLPKGLIERTRFDTCPWKKV